MSAVRAIGLPGIAGLVVWLVVLAAAAITRDPALGQITLLLLFAQLVVAPMGIGLLRVDAGVEDNLVLDARLAFRPAALAVVVSLALPRGWPAAAAAAIWLLPAMFVALAAAVRSVARGWRARPRGVAAEVAQVAASASLVIGAVFFVLHRAGARPADLSDLVVQLTAIHYHVTGFGLLIVAGELAVVRRGRGRGAAATLGAGAVALIAAGLVVVPIGFLTAPIVQAVGGMAVAAGLALVGVGVLLAVPGGRLARGSRPWLVVCGLTALVVAAVATLAVLDAAGSGRPLTTHAMLAFHGWLLAVGVVFCGLLGWRMTR